MKSKPKGYVLVELLVVITIIGIISTVAFVSLNSARIQARDATRLHDIDNLMKSFEVYYAGEEGYPSSVGCNFSGTCPPDWNCADICGSNGQDDWLPDMNIYLEKLPSDLLNERGFPYHYFYLNPTQGWLDTSGNPIPDSPYLLCFVLEKEMELDNAHRHQQLGNNLYCKGLFQ
ncbi:MAG: type II secretion system protein [Patescibacteria group bacterium]